MARSSPSLVNEAPPATSTEAPEMVTQASPSSTAPSSEASVSSASATATVSPPSTVVATTLTSTPSSCMKASSGVTSPSSVDVSPDVPSSLPTQRYAHVPPTVLQSVKASLTFRKSCLKRSKSSPLPPPVPFETTGAFTTQVEEKKDEIEKKPVQKNRRRCWECKVKVGLTAVKCRCDYTFCVKHRYAEEHKCVYNFKTAGKRKLEEENPVVVPSKVARIN
ncbi:hypothetical protein PsorP6_002959 [Peronosclerospora sorghi]|uniref:Uncharacterized protein n=1 Tax=Peronosclerospora sorghi TaxID=230839 RepID=A0ACC0VRB8_9STRA|nr:hypothetical protein PsorP6_002959 [Peronosclerospora sorghi]